MDWPKAKTILIVGFLLVDLYLAWLLYSGSRVNVVTQLTDDDVQEMVTLCHYYGAELGAEPVPLQVGKATNLALSESKNTAAAADAAATMWLGSGWAMTQPTAGSLLYQLGDCSLKATPGRYSLELVLQLTPEGSGGQPGNEAESIKLARDFLAEHLGQTEALLYQPGMISSDPASGLQLIELNLQQQGLPSFMDYYQVNIQDGQVVGFQARQSYAAAKAGQKQQLVAADRPLKRYLAQAGIQDKQQFSISDLRLGFGLLPGDEETLQPVWRLIASQSDQGQTEVFFPAAVRYWGS